MELEDITSVGLRTLFTLTEKPKPLAMLALDIYGQPGCERRVSSNLRNLQNNGWAVDGNKHEAWIDGEDIKLLAQFDRLVLAHRDEVGIHQLTRTAVSWAVREAERQA